MCMLTQLIYFLTRTIIITLPTRGLHESGEPAGTCGSQGMGNPQVGPSQVTGSWNKCSVTGTGYTAQKTQTHRSYPQVLRHEKPVIPFYTSLTFRRGQIYTNQLRTHWDTRVLVNSIIASLDVHMGTQHNHDCWPNSRDKAININT